MQTILLSLVFLFPNFNLINIDLKQKSTDWQIEYTFKANSSFNILAKECNAIFNGRLQDNHEHINGAIVKNLNLTAYDKNQRYTMEYCQNGYYKKFTLEVLDKNKNTVESLRVRPNEIFYIYIRISHVHEPYSKYETLSGDLLIDLQFCGKRFPKQFSFAQKESIPTPLIIIEEPWGIYGDEVFFKSSPKSLVLSDVYDPLASNYWSRYYDVKPRSKIRIEFYYYLYVEKNYKFTFTVKENTEQSDYKEKNYKIPSLKKFNGWQKFSTIYTVPDNIYQISLRFNIVGAFVWIDEIKTQTKSENP